MADETFSGACYWCRRHSDALRWSAGLPHGAVSLSDAPVDRAVCASCWDVIPSHFRAMPGKAAPVVTVADIESGEWW